MTILQSVAMLLSICAVCAYLNQRTVKWPPVLAMTMMSIVLAVVLITLGRFGVIEIDKVESFVRSFDFADMVLHGVLGLLLFAGAVFVDFNGLKKWWRSVLMLATVGVLISAFVTAGALWVLINVVAASFIDFQLSFWWCLLFGALIAPTDPIAALAIVKKAGAPKQMEVKLVGESLINDGSGVMLFLIVLGIVKTGEMSTGTLIHEALVAPIGAIVLGLGAGWLTTFGIRRVDDHPTEIMMTLALATGVYGFAEYIHVSAPIAVVAAGLVIGHSARQKYMSEKTREHLDTFWEGMDEVINALLFALIGLELILIDVPPAILILGVATWVLVLVGRGAGVFGALVPLRHRGSMGKGTMKVMVWGGLRGGISLALALSLPTSKEANILIALTFIVVSLSAAIQGLTLAKVIPKQAEADKDEGKDGCAEDGCAVLNEETAAQK